MKNIVKKAKCKNEFNKTQMNCENALKLEEFSKYLLLASELSKVTFNTLIQKEKFLFFLNVYQAMYMHYIIDGYKGTLVEHSFFKKIKSLIVNEGSKFEYNISGQNLSLEIIKHVIFRRNKKPNNCYFKLAKESDPIAKILNLEEDPRVLLVLKDYPEVPEKFYIFKNVNTLNKDLNQIADSVLNSAFFYDSDNSEILIPMVFSTYKSDFGKNDLSIIKWIFNNSNLKIEENFEEFLSKIKNKIIQIRYRENDPEYVLS